MKKSNKLPSKVLSVFMAILIASVSVPFAYAAETLKSSNVSQYPTISYKNADGKMYFGQTEAEGLIINDDEIVLDASGNQVAGHFTFKDIDKIPTNGTGKKLNLTFVPDNPDEYTSFNKMFSPVLYDVETVTPVYVDEVNDPVVASEIEAGSTLKLSTLSGGKMTNPYNPEEPKILARTWEWVDPYTVVNESGYYEAMFAPAGYEKITAQVYVRIAGEIPETTITEAPTVPSELFYDGVTTWGDIELKGGKAELKIEGTEVEGTFAVTEFWKTRIVNVGSYEIDVVFTPTDPEAALPYSLKIPVTVNKAPIKFVDENGNEIVPEITVEYGTKFYDVVRLLQPYVKGAEYTALSLGDLEYKECEDGTFTVTASAPSDGAHYETTELSFKIIIEKKKLNPKLYSEPGKLYIEDTSGIYNPTGTFTLEYTIDGVEQTPITGIKYLEKFDWNPTKSGDYEYEIVYVEAAEKEYYIIDDFTASNAVKLLWSFSATGMNATATYSYGAAVSYTAPATDLTKPDKPYYVFSEWSEVKGIEMTDEQKSNPEVSFTMPDNDVELEASYKFSFKAFLEWIWAKVVQFFTFVINAVKDLVALAAA